MNSEYYLPAPAFGLAWYKSSTSPLAYILMPGGGGSSKTGVKNQIMLASLNPEAKQQAQVQLLSGFLTDTEDRSNFCSGISYGTILDTPVVCAIMANRCVIYAVTIDKDQKPQFEKKAEVDTPIVGEESDLNCSLITEDGLLVSGGDGKVVHVWSIATDPDLKGDWEGEQLFELKQHTGAITALSEHPFSSWLCSASKDGSCKLWDLSTGQLMLDIPALIDLLPNPNPKLSIECRGCCFSADGSSLYSIQCSRRGPTNLITWELTSKIVESSEDDEKTHLRLSADVQKTKMISKVAASKLVLSDDGLHLGVGVADGHLVVLSTSDLSQLADIACHDFPVTGLGFAPSHIAKAHDLTVMVATCSADRLLKIIRISKRTWTVLLLQIVFVLLLIPVLALLVYSTYGVYSMV